MYGGIAQLARAIGSYPIGRGFKSNFRYHEMLYTAEQMTHIAIAERQVYVFYADVFPFVHLARWSRG